MRTVRAGAVRLRGPARLGLTDNCWKEDTMCQPKSTCQKPEQLKGTPEECSREQIQKCHGTEKDHPCVPSEKKQ